MHMARRLFGLGLLAGWRQMAAAQDPLEQQFPDPNHPRRRFPGEPDPDAKLPNGKSRANAIAEEEHKKALEEIRQLVQLSQDLEKELSKNGKFVVSVSAVKKTEEIEKLARRIRGHLRA
jgi:hypothetical protein